LFGCWLVGWLVGWFDGRMAGWLDGWLVGWIGIFGFTHLWSLNLSLS